MPRAASRPARRSPYLAAACAFLLALFALIQAPAAADQPKQSFEQWLKALRKDAQGAGISKPTLDKALDGLQPNPKVIELDENQPEFTMTFDDYISRLVSDDKVQKGHELLIQNQTLLDQVAAKYGVQPRFIIALWGIESRYGERMGEFKVINSLATLGYASKRGKFFRKELLAALKIADQDKIDPDAMMGSWSGAMGQSQFIPSSFQAFAVDYDGDGKRDIWGTQGDIFASIANYLAKSKWQAGQTWGREVQLPPGFDQGLVGPEKERKLAEWQQLGVRAANGATLPVVKDMKAYLVQPAGVDGRSFLVYANFKTILRWNKSDFFGIAVGLLADRVSAG